MSGPWEDYAPAPVKSAAKKAVQPQASVAPRYKQTPQEAATIYSTTRGALEKKLAGRTPQERQKALARFDADPRMQSIRKYAGMPEVRTRQEEVRDTARRNLDSRREKSLLTNIVPKPIQDFSDSLNAGVQNFFGLGPRLDALIRGGGEENLEIAREENRQLRDRSTAGNVVGTLAGDLLGGGAVSGAIKSGGVKLAASSRPGLAKAGNYLQGLVTLNKGQLFRNTAKLVGGGAAGGAAQAAGEGSDVGTGATYGAGGALALGTVAKAVGAGRKAVRGLARPHSNNIDKALREVVSEAPEAIAARQADLVRRTGNDVPLVAALRDRDFTNVTERVLKNSPESAEIAKSEIAKSVRGFMDRMMGHVNLAGKQGQAMNTTLGDLAQLRKDASDDLMKPIENNEIDLLGLNLEGTEKQAVRDIGSRIKGMGPRIRQALRDVDARDLDVEGVSPESINQSRKLLNDWLGGKPVRATVREMDNLRRSLDAAARSSAGSNPANSMDYHNAAKSIRAFVEHEYPEYGKVVDTYAANSRMLEGFQTSAAGKRISDIEDDLLRGNLQTKEGRVGLKAGELYRLREGANKSPSSAIALSRNLAAGGNLTRQGSVAGDAAQPGLVTENLGSGPSARLADASEAEYQVLQKMMQNAGVDAASLNAPSLDDPGTIVYAALLGKAMPITQARFIMKLLENRPFKQEVAENLTKMLFSTDPAQSAKAFTVLKSQGLDRGAVVEMMRGALPITGGIMGAQGVLPPEELPPEEVIAEELPVEENPGPWEDFDAPVNTAGDIVTAVFPKASRYTPLNPGLRPPPKPQPVRLQKNSSTRRLYKARWAQALKR